jgi:PAS domain S-box-containing protein
MSDADSRDQNLFFSGELAAVMVDTIRESLLVLDDELRIQSANRSFYDSFGVTFEEAQGRSVFELGDGEWNIPEFHTLLQDRLPAQGFCQDYEIDYRFERIGHRRMLLNGRVLPPTGERPRLILLAIESQTLSGQHGVEFRDSRDCYRVIAEPATSYAIFTFDRQGTITSWNRGAERFLGYKQTEILGRDVRIIFTPEDVAAGQADVEMWTAEHEGKALDERWHVRKEGGQFWANGLVLPLKDDEEETRGFIKILRDMTAEKELEASLRERTEALERADANKNEFLAMLAHELRNPLAAIRNVLAVAERSKQKEDLDWGLEIIGRQVRNFGHLIDDLLDVARITQGKVHLRKEIFDATAIVRSAAEAVRPLVEERKHDLLLSFTSRELKIEADPTRLEQILVNLLTNAAKYTPSGGRIELHTGIQGTEAVFRVRDNGVGIPPEQLPQMFELFAQGSRSLARSEGGLGIGLTLVRSLAELHGGTVSASSEGPSTGSEFVVRLPALGNEPSVAVVPVEGNSAEQAARGHRVLVVDDHKDTAEGIARLLKLDGHTVRVANNGFDAVREARQLHPEFILLDIGLPGMDGYEVAEMLRKEECCRDSILVAISGYGDEASRIRSAEAGFDHHLVKPVKPESLLTLLQR